MHLYKSWNFLSKLLNNFLSLGNGALVNHLAIGAKELGLDLQKVFSVAKLGSGNSSALNRVFDNLLNVKLAFTWFSAFAVQIGSLEARMLLMRISWFKKEPIINTLCEIDLSPGQSSSPFKHAEYFVNKFKLS